MQFRKKPVEIEAMQLLDEDTDAAKDRIVAVWAWMGSAADATRITTESLPFGLEIETLEGTMLAAPGDWIIRGVKGEFYPCKPDVFAQTYEPV